MTVPDKGSRRVRVGEATYKWRIRKKPKYARATSASMKLAVQRVEPPGGSVLVVDLGVTRPDNWLDRHQTSVTPAVVRTIVLEAIEAGWDASSTKPFPFEFPLIRDGFVPTR